jgi:uncharacterized membrane protein
MTRILLQTTIVPTEDDWHIGRFAMLRDHLVKAHPERDGAFRWRGDGVSRIEGLSDAVFGFAITLLVVSLGVPQTYAELTRMIAGFPAFAATFALLVLVWAAQYRFFRRYGLEDARTIRLNVVLLCLVVFFVYPLKFLFTTFIALWLGPLGYVLDVPVLMAQSRAAQRALSPSEWPAVMAVFSAAHVAMYAVFALLHRHALRCADQLELDALEVLETRRTIVEHLVQMGIAVASVAVTFTVAYGLGLPPSFAGVMGGPPGFAALVGGFVYALTGPVMVLVSRAFRPRRAALLAARAADEGVPAPLATPAAV